ncbi:MAG: hypothetical protein BCS36_08795 [Desulfovibrio sp. MES5]|uniref:hypothetical protein n=1 Tax=Desulfovibrio sp. MES5 TaxID=1899016 RepID=UPI000B9CEA48|nr:hypothetical protein [Desulfovibrio sp. MES5]OXS28836.1 MAG: hypothetical protein BCS36_08795 [Desulfovibrio sp. MES5]
MNREIGGYMDISGNAPAEMEILPGALSFNSCRNALEFLIRERRYKRIRLPVYVCADVFQAVERAGAKALLYHMDENLMPVDVSLDDIPLVYVNYFGLAEANVHTLARLRHPLVVDNAQAFFSRPLPKVDCLYSPRKFFGVPDGGLLCPGEPFSNESLANFNGMPRAVSFEHGTWLFKRADCGASAAYADRQANEERIRGLPPLRMSESTRHLLAACNIEYAHKRRQANWRTLHRALAPSNLAPSVLLTAGDSGAAALCYPYLNKNAAWLRERLAEKKIYIPHYWPGLETIIKSGSIEHLLLEKLLPLPIDQRYGANDMTYMLDVLRGVINT